MKVWQNSFMVGALRAAFLAALGSPPLRTSASHSCAIVRA
ncbi:hypothetical protein KEGY108214_10710 [Kerstersia gyiorum]